MFKTLLNTLLPIAFSALATKIKNLLSSKKKLTIFLLNLVAWEHFPPNMKATLPPALSML
jgi:hypothetical protein